MTAQSVTRRVPAIAFTVLALVSVSFAQASGKIIRIGNFTEEGLTGWKNRSFKRETRYSFVIDPETKTRVLQAEADGSASGLFKKIKVDLAETPFLNWSWKVTNTFAGIDENKKAGDDFSVRIYVVVERGIAGVRSLSLNYVWASQHSIRSMWPSPYTKQVQLLALDSGSQGLNTWVQHKRDIRADLKRAFGEDFSGIDAVALMTDTDNHGGRATSFYGDIWFSAE